MNNIQWGNGAVCYANDNQWLVADSGLIFDCADTIAMHCSSALKYTDFQLNEIRTGDYIEASELNTEQKYNDVVEVFGLSGFEKRINFAVFSKRGLFKRLLIDDEHNCPIWANSGERKLTYPQIMAIGKLKRLMEEKEKLSKEWDGKINRKAGYCRCKQVEISENLKATSNKYEHEITDRQGNSAIVDVYDVLKAFNVTCPATQHAVKKLLCSGIRGHKDLATDLVEARESIVRAIELNG